MLVALLAGINPINVPNTTNITTAIKTTTIGTDALIKIESGPLPKAESIAIKIQPPVIIPKIPAIIFKKIDSITICLFISKGVAPIALLMPISFVRDLNPRPSPWQGDALQIFDYYFHLNLICKRAFV